MSPRRSSRVPKASKKSSQKSASLVKEVLPQRLKGKRPKTGPKKAKVDDSIGNTDEGSDRDILDIINGTNAARRVAKEEESFVKVTDEGVDESDEDRYSVSSSVASGPSLLLNTTAKKWRPSKGECSACRKLYQKAKRMKAPIKNKLLDNGECTDNVTSVWGNWVVANSVQRKTSMFFFQGLCQYTFSNWCFEAE